MNIDKNIKFDWSDFCLVAEILTDISSRKEVNVLNESGKLPLIVSPMDTVVDYNTSEIFDKQGFEVCMPRGVESFYSDSFKSISLSQFEQYVQSGFIQDKPYVDSHYKLLVDIANGHQEKLYQLTVEFRQNRKFNHHELMIGNIANPDTYRLFAKLGVDYIRVGIGGGSACTTSANTGVHYPMGSLISECYAIKKDGDYDTKIVADGGFKNYDDIIKALALGADYVMLGSILNKCLESCAPTKLFGIDISSQKEFIWNQFPRLRKYMKKSYRGMSTKAVQKKWGREKLVTSEGITKENKLEYTIAQWKENFEDYLRSAMSYCNAQNLEEFKESKKIFISQEAFRRFHK